MKLKSYINTMLDDIFIMSYYTNLTTGIIEDCIITGQLINNPLRYDKKPSSSFKFRNDKLYLTDYAQPDYSGDIYAIVGIKLGLNSNDGSSFIKICEDVINNLIVNKKNYNKFKRSNVTTIDAYQQESTGTKRLTNITVEYLNWNNVTFKYWFEPIRPNRKLAKLLINELQYLDIYPIKKYWLNDNNRASKVATDEKPIYSYLLKINDNFRFYKLYLPNRKPKFTTNASDTFNYLNKYSDNKYGVLVKSIKDAIYLTIIAKYLNIFDITFIPVNSESTIITNLDYDLIKDRFEHIFVFYDWDETGIKYAFKLSVEYPIIPLFIVNNSFKPLSIKVESIKLFLKTIDVNVTVKDFINFINNYKSKSYIKTKDFAEYLEEYGVDKGIKFFETIYHSFDTVIQKPSSKLPRTPWGY